MAFVHRAILRKGSVLEPVKESVAYLRIPTTYGFLN
jgi:hypothetical protein